jgi:hypothetical protein
MYIIVHIRDLDNVKKYFDSSCTTNIIDIVDRIIINVIDYSFNNVLSMVAEFDDTKIKYIILESNMQLIQNLMKIKARCIYYPHNKDLKSYVDIGCKILDSECVPIFGCMRNPMPNSAGVLPIIHHEGKLFCAFSVDKAHLLYSDFGGKYDKVYSKHRGIDSFKDSILKDKQIFDGSIDPTILSDHYSSLELDQNTSNKVQLSHKCNASNTLITNLPNPLGYGDINSKYTAFRELIEESSYNEKDDIGCVFDVNMIYDKLYNKNAFMYLGGDILYGYDLYVMFLSIDDLAEKFKKDFLRLYEEFHTNPLMYIESRVETGSLGWNCGRNRTSAENLIKIPNNKETYAIDILPLSHIVQNIKHINYMSYRFNNPYSKIKQGFNRDHEFKRNQFEQKEHYIYKYQYSYKHFHKQSSWISNRHHSLNQSSSHMQSRQLCKYGIMQNYHELTFGTKILDKMRRCFVDTLIKYNKEFEFIEIFFNDIKNIFSIL